jgi:hypothetical protein
MRVISKSLFASKMFWLGLLQIASGTLELVGTEVLGSDGAGWAAVGSGVVTIVLRVVTKQPVTVKGGDEVELPPSATP